MTFTGNHPVDGDDIQTALSTYVNQNLTHLKAAIDQEHDWSDSDATLTKHPATLFKYSVGVITRALDGSNGAVDESLSFTPQIVLFFGEAIPADGETYSKGGYDGTNTLCIFSYYLGGVTLTKSSTSSYCIALLDGATTQAQYATCAFATNKFTLTWTKLGTPTSTNAKIFYVALRFSS